jgi:Domain of unknown function (DUF1841)
MFGFDREAYRKLFKDVYYKMNSEELLSPLESQIALVLQQHPYYHVLFQNDKSLERDYLAVKGSENPFLHMSLHLTLQDQIRTDRPHGITDIYQQLLLRGLEPHDVQHQMIAILADTLWNALKYKREGNEAEYLQRLQALLVCH